MGATIPGNGGWDTCPARGLSTRDEGAAKFSLKWDICPETGGTYVPVVGYRAVGESRDTAREAKQPEDAEPFRVLVAIAAAE